MAQSRRSLWLASAGAAGALWLGWHCFGLGGGESPAASAPATAVAPSASAAGWGASASAAASAASAAAPVASAALPVTSDPAEAARRSHEMFARAVEEAAKKPPQPVPPEIAKAKTFPEAFEAMQALQRRAQEGAPAGTAAINPFGAASAAPAQPSSVR